MNDVATVLLAGVAAEIPDLATKRVCVYPGSQYPWDECECGSIAVYMTQMYHSAVWPPVQVPDDGHCPPNYVVLDYSVVVLRCAPGPQGTARAPLCTHLAAAAELVFTDMSSMRIGVSNAVTAMINANTIMAFALGAHAPVGPQGQCVGSQFSLSIGIANEWRTC